MLSKEWRNDSELNVVVFFRDKVEMNRHSLYYEYEA